MLVKAYKREAIFIPLKGLPKEAVAKVKDKLSFKFYSEKACQSCEWRAERHCDMCDTCPAFTGGYDLASVVKMGEKNTRYLKIPIGSSPKILNVLEKHHHVRVNVIDKARDIPIRPIKFTGKLRPEQVAAIDAMKTAKRGVLKSPPRSGKCIVGSSLVMTAQGIHPLRDMFRAVVLDEQDETIVETNTTIATKYGSRQVAHLYSKVVDTTVSVTTGNGYSIRGTPNHPIQVATHRGLKWVQLENLKLGDWVAVSRKEQWLGKGDSLLAHNQDYRNEGNTHFTPTNPKVMTVELARLLGYWVANGALSVAGRLGISSHSRSIRNDFAHCLKTVFVGASPKLHTDKVGNKIGVGYNSLRICGFLQDACGLTFGVAREKSIPSVLFGIDRRFMLEFLGAYTSCAAYIHRNGIEYCSASTKLLSEFQVVLSYMGVVSNKSFGTSYARNGSGVERRYASLDVNREAAMRLQSMITLRGNRRCVREGNGKVERIPYGLSMLCKVQKDYAGPTNGSWCVGGVVHTMRAFGTLLKINRKGLAKGDHALRSNLENINFHTLEKLDPSAAKTLRSLTNPDLFFTQIKSIRTIDKPVRVYDVSVPIGEQFIANGIVNHNTVMGAALVCELGGKTLLLASQRDWLMGFRETFVGSKTQVPLTSLGETRIGFCKTLQQFRDTDICMATVQTFYSPAGEKLLEKIRSMFNVIILDECFPKGTLVHTDKGAVPIERVASNPSAYKALSLNHKSNKWEYRQVVHGLPRPITQRKLVKLTLEDGTVIRCTEEHRLWVPGEGRYVEAKNLQLGIALLSRDS